ncbi:hypothetical protein CDZ97_15455 [Mameliella alba]|nr:hypothetical protein CDZ95_13975 [Mameliella alba]OWV63458.1 hypothetical protein CDZ97_15455 [Mameliella alba]
MIHEASMSDFRHLERPRSRPEIFGLSTLDTVTCALGGAIILMIFMAALTDRQAKVTLTPHRKILESGDREPATPTARATATSTADPKDMENLVVVYLDGAASRLGQAPSIEAPTKACVSLDFQVRTLRSAPEHFGTDGDDLPVAFSVWAAGDAAPCTGFTLHVPAVHAAPCEATLVSSGHYQTRQFSSCRASMVFESNGDKVYRFEREY